MQAAAQGRLGVRGEAPWPAGEKAQCVSSSGRALVRGARCRHRLGHAPLSEGSLGFGVLGRAEGQASHVGTEYTARPADLGLWLLGLRLLLLGLRLRSLLLK